MSIRVQLPPILRPVMGGERTVEASGSSIGAVLSDLKQRHPALMPTPDFGDRDPLCTVR